MPFDVEEIDVEFDALERSSPIDAAKLQFCMARLEDVNPNDNPSPAIVWTFDEGFKELRHKSGSYKGRLLFYEPKIPAGEADVFVMLRVFRKSTQKTPKSEIKKAIQRMNADRKKRLQSEGK